MNIKPDSKLMSRIHLNYLTAVFFTCLFSIVTSILVYFFADPSEVDHVITVTWVATGGISILVWIILTIIASLWVKNLSYSIECDRVTIHKGIIAKIQQNIPYRAITDFQLYRSFWDRVLGIGSIRIQTAGKHTGGTGFEGVLSGLLDYEDLHLQLRAKLTKLHPTADMATGVQSRSAAPDSDVSYQMLEELRAIRKSLERS